MTETTTALAKSGDAQPVAVQGKVTFLLLCSRARVNRRMANALRVKLGLKRSQVNKECSEAEFNKALYALLPDYKGPRL